MTSPSDTRIVPTANLHNPLEILADGDGSSRPLSGNQPGLEQSKDSPCASRSAPSDTTQRVASPSPHLESLQLSHTQTEDLGGADASNPRLVPRQGTLLVGVPSLQSVVKAGALPLYKAAGLAGQLRDQSKRLGSVVAHESISYYEKVAGMWQGGQQHYDDVHYQQQSDRLGDEALLDERSLAQFNQNFRLHFALPTSERLIATYFGYFHRVLPLYGKLYISASYFCFRSLLPGTSTRFVLPLRDVENVGREEGFRFGYSGIVIVVKGHEELFFEFSRPLPRDDLEITLLRILDQLRSKLDTAVSSEDRDAEIVTNEPESPAFPASRRDRYDIQPWDQRSESLFFSQPSLDASSLRFDDPKSSILSFRPTQPLRICCLTIGSRGDVQPYIALCKGLVAHGHRVKIATHQEFKPWIESHGIEFGLVEGDPAELMRICVENGMFTYSFLKEASSKFRAWIDHLLRSAWKTCQTTAGHRTEVLIESPSAMAGIHIAEALSIPYFRSFSMPWTRTRAYPHAFAVPDRKMGGAYNYLSYVMFDNVFWKATANQINRWRREQLSLARTTFEKMQPNKVPFLYSYSPAVVAPPLDYSDWIHVTGYWFLDEASSWEAPVELLDFISTARKDGKKLVYVGFGSIVVSDPAALTRLVVDSILKAGVRCILSKGWSDRLGAEDANAVEIPIPPEILQVTAVPHDWLFRRIDAAAHHGGAGTTGASLRAGLPTIVKPFFGDQFFFGDRVEDLNVGICVRKPSVESFSRALWEACYSERIRTRARAVGQSIRNERGVETAIESIYRDLEYAKTLILVKAAHQTSELDDCEDDEGSWTFVENEASPDSPKTPDR